MAEDIVIGVEVDPSGKGAKSLKSLKDDFRVLQKELENTKVGTKEYQKALENLGNVKDEIGDLRDTISALNPEGKVQAFSNVAGKLAGGFQAATGAAALFGAQSEELEKQLLKVQAATALAQGIQSVTGLGDAFKVLGVVIAANPLMALGAVVIALVAGFKLYIDSIDETTLANERLTQSIKDQEEATKSLERQNDERIRTLKANGATEIEILNEKLKQAEYNLKRQGELLQKQLQLVNNTSDEERKKNYDKYVSMFQDAQSFELKVSESRKAISDYDEKLEEEAAKRAVKRTEDQVKEQIRIHKQYVQERATVEFLAEALSWETVILPQKQKEAQAEIDLQLKVDNSKADSAKKLKATTDALEILQDKKKQAQAEAELQIQQNYFNAVGDLSTTYFNFEINAAKGNSKKIEELRKKQFNVEKAINAAKATILTFQAINATLADPLLGPLRFPLAISVGVAGFANVAKILSTKYNGGVVTSNSNPDLNTGGAPNIQTQAPVSTTSTRLNEQGQNISQQPVRAYVVETDVTESQSRVARLQEQSTF